MDENNKKKKRPQDITSAERLQRVNECKELLIKGCSRPQIIEFYRDKYNINNPSTVDFYIQESREQIKQDFKDNFDIEYFKANIYERYEALYRENIDIDDFKECRAILKDFRDMFGLNAPIKTVNENTTTERKRIEFIENDEE